MNRAWWYITMALLPLILSFILMSNCGIFNPEDNCDVVGGEGMSPIKCSGSYSKTISNIRYDGLGNVSSYDYSVTCGGKTYSGHVDNKARTITVNGSNCKF